MTMASVPTFPGFAPDALAALDVQGANERWAAVQERLHPPLAALAEALRSEGSRRFPREWPLYEISFKSLRYVNRGAGTRTPIDEYHVALDRPPRGAGIYVVVSAAERRIIVALQLWRRRKDDLRHVWEVGRPIWLPLITCFDEVRFADRQRAIGERRTAADEPLPGQVLHEQPSITTTAVVPSQTWLDRYLASRSAAYLLVGFSYAWDDACVAQPDFADRVIDDVLALFPLNEAIMEQAEALEGGATLRERHAVYSPLTLPPVEVLVERIQARGFALADSLIRAYHIALQIKPLVILPGISGTGKTRLTRLYADAVYGDTLTSGQENEHYLLVAVQPDWHNARDLLGYYNALTQTFHPTPFLRFLHRAAADPAMPFFVCLDELNLARPEYYLAPILSALETEDHLIDLGIPGEVATTISGEVLRNPFRLPLNVRITGTVNVDESTYALSDKLLDRANVIELTDVDLEAFRRTYRGPIDAAAWSLIVQTHAIVARAGQPFGYRTVAEILRYVEQARGVLPAMQALDQQIKQKILPKLRGDDSMRLRRALTELLEILLGTPRATWLKAADIEPDHLAAAPYPESAAKVRRMLERLDTEGFTDFYG